MRNIFFPKMKKGTFYSPTSGGRSLEVYLPLLFRQSVGMRSSVKSLVQPSSPGGKSGSSSESVASYGFEFRRGSRASFIEKDYVSLRRRSSASSFKRRSSVSSNKSRASVANERDDSSMSLFSKRDSVSSKNRYSLVITKKNRDSIDSTVTIQDDDNEVDNMLDFDHIDDQQSVIMREGSIVDGKYLPTPPISIEACSDGVNRDV